MSDRKQDALRYHEEGRPGKIQVVPTKATSNQRDLSLAYTPGVAIPCLAIAERPEDAYRYTARGNLVAVVSNGTAVLGLGDIGPLAGKPVMEGKGVLFKTFADIDVFDLEINANDPDDVIRFCEALEPTVGGINLEDIKSPDCFYIEERLRASLSIPVFHDDQHGTAIISGAALLNGLDVVGKKIDEVRCVFLGAGAAAIATAEHYVRLGVRREHITLVDKIGVINSGRTDLDPYKLRFVHDPAPQTRAEAIAGADVFVGLSAAHAVPASEIATMARDPLVFALANPDPEITPEEVRAVRPDAIIATGRTDYPNQVNNVLGFPFIFRGALDVRARAINEEMKMAATRALAALAREDVPEVVLRAYGVDQIHFGRDYLIPKPFDPRVLLWVAPAVAWAAISSGVATQPLDLDEYRQKLESRLSRGRAVMRSLSNRASMELQRVAMTDAEDPRILRAARIIRDEGSAQPILVGHAAEIAASAEALGMSLEGMEIADPYTSPKRAAYAQQLWARRRRRGITEGEALRRMRLSSYFGAGMVAAGDADALVVGENQHYPDAIKPAMRVIGAEPGKAVAGIYMMVFQGETIFLADCTVNIDPDSQRLKQIALAAGAFVRKLGIEPRIAMLSFSNFGSVKHPASRKVWEAVAMLHQEYPQLHVDGEMQADTALVESILTRYYPNSRLGGKANVLIFPELSGANICYKLLSNLAGAQAIGPILVGMAAPVHVLQRGSDVDTIVNLTVIAAVDAQERARARHARPAAAPTAT
ncbi:MAG TPA: NADP-dependent malic enzyme [Gemmatimonadales bacterium]|nr:NADP-dependent malic enzyme [Gemmatimonadales bacterium]